METTAFTRLNVHHERGMASAGEEDTGVPCFIEVRAAPDGKHKQPTVGVRLVDANFKSKVGTALFTISDEPKQFKTKVEIPAKLQALVESWIVLNKTNLLKYWRHELLTSELFRLLKKI